MDDPASTAILSKNYSRHTDDAEELARGPIEAVLAVLAVGLLGTLSSDARKIIAITQAEGDKIRQEVRGQFDILAERTHAGRRQVDETHTGAAKIELNGARNQTPALLNYEMTEAQRDKVSGCYHVSGFSVLWPSGATVSSDRAVRLCGSGPAWTFNVVRPSDAPNLEIDQATERAVMAVVRAAEADERQRTQQAIFNILGYAAAGAAEGYAESKDVRRSASSSPSARRTKAITCHPSLTKDPFTGRPTSYNCD